MNRSLSEFWSPQDRLEQRGAAPGIDCRRRALEITSLAFLSNIISKQLFLPHIA